MFVAVSKRLTPMSDLEQISAAEGYKGLFEPLVEWKKFRRRFLKFIDEIAVQEAQLHLNLEALLRPIVDSEAQLHTLLYSSTSDLFHDTEITQRLENRLSAFKLYDACMSIIKKMNDELNDLKKLLCLGDGGVSRVTREVVLLWQLTNYGA